MAELEGMFLEKLSLVAPAERSRVLPRSPFPRTPIFGENFFHEDWRPFFPFFLWLFLLTCFAFTRELVNAGFFSCSEWPLFAVFPPSSPLQQSPTPLLLIRFLLHSTIPSTPLSQHKWSYFPRIHRPLNGVHSIC